MSTAAVERVVANG